jgi:SAM-dependent methyltransferase
MGNYLGETQITILSILMFSKRDWDEQFSQQAGWTSQVRHYIFDKVSLSSARSILDIGCGTGIIENELIACNSIKVTALDVQIDRLKFARERSDANWICGDAFSLPFADRSFDISLCHYLLLWLKDPISALSEMKRITRPGGYILLLAEPDYAHRIDFPEELDILGKLQSDALREQGANPALGPSIAGLLDQAGIEVIETGLSGGQWNPVVSSRDSVLEWKILENDLSVNTDMDQLQRLKQIDQSARKAGTRILFVPVFYAIGRIPR